MSSLNTALLAKFTTAEQAARAMLDFAKAQDAADDKFLRSAQITFYLTEHHEVSASAIAREAAKIKAANPGIRVKGALLTSATAVTAHARIGKIIAVGGEWAMDSIHPLALQTMIINSGANVKVIDKAIEGSLSTSDAVKEVRKVCRAAAQAKAEAEAAKKKEDKAAQAQKEAAALADALAEAQAKVDAGHSAADTIRQALTLLQSVSVERIDAEDDARVALAETSAHVAMLANALAARV